MLKKSLCILSLLPALSGCGVVVGAAAGGYAVHERKTIEAAYEDQKLHHRIAYKIDHTPAFKDSHVSVTSFRKNVLMTGQVPNTGLRQKAERIAWTFPGVKRVYNQLAIKKPTSLITRSSDTWITTRVKAEMLVVKQLKSRKIKIVTEDGVVYLMGDVNKEQAELAVDVARQISKVRKVVKIFHYTA